MNLSVAIPSSLNNRAVKHLLRADGQEDLCFGLWRPSEGRTRLTALLHSLVLPRRGERSVHGNASFLGCYFERALGIALESRSGLALLHSHPAVGWQGMSNDDVAAELGHAAQARGATGHPLLGLTIGSDCAWSARFWEKVDTKKYQMRWCQSVRVVGDRLRATYCEELLPEPSLRSELARTISAWGGPEQTHLARLTAGVVGAGSVGTLVAEALARMGIAHVVLIDYDVVEVQNLGCLLHARRSDALEARPKVLVLADAITASATASGFNVEPFQWSIVETEGYRRALDCDVLFSCVDRPWARFVLNFIAYAHLIPVVDGGISAQQQRNQRGLLRANWRAHVAAPGRKCLECLRQYDPGLVAVERDGYLEAPTYINNLPDDHTLKRRENVFAFSLAAASAELQQFLRMIVATPGLSNPGAWLDDFVTGSRDTDPTPCKKGCLFPSLTAMGERSEICVTGIHPIAEHMRQLRKRPY
jgi:molybdopterin-synthase adenylyltransferase